MRSLQTREGGNVRCSGDGWEPVWLAKVMVVSGASNGDAFAECDWSRGEKFATQMTREVVCVS